MSSGIALEGVSELIVDCEHRTAPPARPGFEFAYSIGTSDIRNGRILIDHAKRVDSDTYGRWTQRAVPRAGDLILAREAPVGDVGMIKEGDPICLGQRTVLIRSDPRRASPRYLHYLLLSPDIQRWMEERAAGSTVPHLNVADVRQIRLPQLPPLPEQRAIAEVLGALDDKIEANRRAEELTHDLVSGLYTQLTEQGSDFTAPLMDVVEFTFGEPFNSSFFNTSQLGRPLIRIRDLKTFQPQFFTTEVRHRETLVEPGDIVVGMDAEFRPTIWCGESGLLNQRVCLAKTLLGSTAFAFKLLEEPLAHVESFKTGTTVSHLNKSDLEQIKVALPNADALRIFDYQAEPLRLKIVALHHENRSIAALRDTLLPKLLSGELRVRDAESLVGEVV